MDTATKQVGKNKTLNLLRQLVAEKQETKRQLRKAFNSDPDFQNAIAELDRQHAAGNA